MPTPQFSSPQGDLTPQQLQDFVVKLIRDLNFMLGNLDTLNVNRLDAKVIIAHTITALQIMAGTITATEIKTNTITADKMSVIELSAIAANLGTITAGIIYGAYIATANGTYPRIEFSSTNNLLQAFKDATNYIAINPNKTGNPTLDFVSGTNELLMAFTAGTYLMNALTGNISIWAQSGDLSLTAGSGKHVVYEAWDRIINTYNNRTLQMDIDFLQNQINNKANAFSGYNGTFLAGTQTVTVSNGIITSVV